jgi:hypothetical protein
MVISSGLLKIFDNLEVNCKIEYLKNNYMICESFNDRLIMILRYIANFNVGFLVLCTFSFL